MKKNELGLVWMSAGNSYFRMEIIEEAMRFAAGKFSKVIVMAPDGPAEHTYRALGYDDVKAARKARQNANLLQNKARRIKEELDAEGLGENLEVVEWSDDVVPNEFYQKRYKEILNLYNTNEKFRGDAEEITRGVLAGKFSNVPSDAIKEAVYYLIEELAFVVASVDIYGVDSVSYIYHRSWPIYDKFIAGEYDGIKKPKLNFLLHVGK